MFKKFLIVALLVLPLGVFAQDKIAYVSTQEIVADMPETKAAYAELEREQKQVESELMTLEDEWSKKYKTFSEQSDTLIESIKTRRFQELQELRQRAESYQQDSQQALQAKYNELFAPIHQKLLDTIKAVGEENGFAYVMEKGAFLFIATTATDATPLVRRKLGLQ